MNLTAEQASNWKKWIAALRSGQYSQIEGEYENECGFCAAGVGYVAVYGVVVDEGEMSELSEHGFGVHVDLAGMSLEIDGDSQELYAINDGGYSFVQIADALEAKLQGGA